LSPEARQKLKEYFISLRQSHHHQHSLGFNQGITSSEYSANDVAIVTARQLESLVRLCEARAKCELREIATAEDAEEVIDLMRQSLYETLSNETGLIDLSRTSGMSRQRDAIRLGNAMLSESARSKKTQFSLPELIDLGKTIGIVKDVNRLIEKMNHNGMLLLKPGRKYQLAAQWDQY
jgi:DNA helicase MCM8